jgi:type VI secretion system protein ImpA
MSLDTEGLLAEISPEDPCGPDLSYDSAYFELMQEAAGTPDQQMGDVVHEGQEPNWREVKSKAMDLFARTKDLNVTMTLMAALVSNDGISGMADGLELLEGVLERHWDGFHPKLDPDDDNDPLERMNIVASLAAAPGAAGDVLRFQARLRDAPLCESKQIGRFGLRDILVARGDLTGTNAADSPPDMALIEGAFSETEIETLKQFGADAKRALETAERIDTWVTEKVGVSNAPNLATFLDLLSQIQKILQEQLARRGYGETPVDEASDGGGTEQGGNDPIRGAVRSHSDVKMLLGKICEFYQREEPSSPVPLLLRRAERLVGKSFIDIVKDLSPDALSQLKMVAGVDTFEDQ